MPDKGAVVDASAAAALLFGEPDGPKVATSLDGRHLFAPSLLRYELASVCLKKTRQNPNQEPAILAALGLFPRLGIQEVLVPLEPLVDLARRTSLTTYDAAYLWLARELRVGLVSLDTRLNEAKDKLG
ncbi:MAG: type II toxin-antitoxin system VapC family toxin [Gemmatimonadota bacterium]|jgi:predicted nucleic acid-binding protein